MFELGTLALIAVVSIAHLIYTVRVLTPLARLRVDLGATLENMAEDLRMTIQQEAKRQDDRVRKQIERVPVDNGATRPEIRAGVPVAR